MFGEAGGDLGYNGFPVSLNYFTALPDPGLLEPGAAVIFKALLKKDPVTKEKALGELLGYLDAEGGDGVVAPWLQMYPKLAIDNARAVRALAHQAQARLLDRIGGKAFAKYLRSCVAVWLLGTLDSDRTVATAAQRAIAQSFHGRDARLWRMFSEQVFGFIAAAVRETPQSLSDARYTREDDLAAKYERVVSGALAMLTRMIRENEGGMDFGPMEEMLATDAVWRHLGVVETRANLGLFKGAVGVARALFGPRPALKAAPQAALEAAPLAVLVAAPQAALVAAPQAALEAGPSGAVESAAALSGVPVGADTSDAPDGASAAPPNPTLASFHDPAALYTLVAKKFLKLVKFAPPKGSNGSIIYLGVILEFWDALVTLTRNQPPGAPNFWQCGSSEAKTRARLLLYLRLGHCQLNAVYFLIVAEFFAAVCARAECRFLVEDAAAIVDALSAYGDSGVPADMRQRSLACVLKVAALLELDVADIAWRVVETLPRGARSLVPTLAEALAARGDAAALLRPMAPRAAAAGRLDAYVELAAAAGATAVLTALVDDAVAALAEGAAPHAPLTLVAAAVPYASGAALARLAPMLAAYVDGNVELVLAVAAGMGAALGPHVGDVLARLEAVLPQHLAAFLLLLGGVAESPAVMEYVRALAARPSRTADEDRLVVALASADVYETLLRRARESDEDGVKFLDALVERGNVAAFEDRALLYAVSWRNAAHPAARAIIRTLCDDPAARTALVESLEEGRLEGVAAIVAEHMQLFPAEEIVASVEGRRTVDAALVSIANPLGQAVYLAPAAASGGADGAAMLLETVGRFLCELKDLASSRGLLVCVGLVGEALGDVALASEADNDVGLALEAHFSHHAKVSLAEAAAALSGASDDTLAAELFHRSQSLYYARLFKRVLQEAVEAASAAEFEACLEPQLRRIASLSGLQQAAVVQACAKFGPRLGAVVNRVVGELLGVRSDQILSAGVRWLAVGLEFGGEVAPHKLQMVLSAFTGWLDSAVAYDEGFLPVRCLLAEFLARVVAAAPQHAPRAYDLAMQVLQDNLSTIQAEPRHLGLRYYTGKLFLALRRGAEYGEYASALEEAWVEVLVQPEECAPSHALALCHDVWGRVFGHAFDPAALGAHADELYALLESPFVAIERIAHRLLLQWILHNQQDFVVEYQLQKKASEGDAVEARLPPALVAIVTQPPHEYVEFEAPANVARYLWAWLLIFCHFADITYLIRNEYTAQLRPVVAGLLDYVFDQEVGAMAPEDITAGVGGADGAVGGADWVDEAKATLAHLYYLTLKHFGSEAALWYNAIRDRQRKLEIEKFTAKFVSPALIAEILDGVAAAKVGGDADGLMTLKVNSTTNEIRLVYAIDDQKMEMVVRIPRLYPLQKVAVEGPLRLGVKETQWKAWLLASQRVISLTNGSVIEAVELFNKNVSLHFSGFEDCAICYSILHQDHSLPSKTCPVCNNKFHAACLYKWFKSSGSSTCPLCRSTFNFLRR